MPQEIDKKMKTLICHKCHGRHKEGKHDLKEILVENSSAKMKINKMRAKIPHTHTNAHVLTQIQDIGDSTKADEQI